MILKDNLYNIESRQDSDEATIFKLRLNPSCFIYKAHFPDNPITPGVCILQTARELIEEIVNRKLEISEVKNVRYLGILSPATNPNVDFFISNLQDDADNVKAQIAVKGSEETFTTISFTCGSAE